jgi:uncharacterized protein YdhG (YjbR/CyaY superfamily)
MAFPPSVGESVPGRTFSQVNSPTGGVARAEETMAKIEISTVDDYIASLPDRSRGLLETVREVISDALPGAEEAIVYDIPTFRIGGRNVIHYAAWKRHYSIYPVGQLVLETLAEELSELEVSKGTIKFLLTDPVPENLIKRIAVLRAREEAEHQAKKKKRR